jgi:hypothetical protein
MSRDPIVNKTFDECKTSCDNSTWCKGFNFNSNTGSCYIAKEITEKWPDYKWNLYEKTEDYTINLGRDAWGNDIWGGYKSGTFFECKAACNERPTCKGFNFESKNYPNSKGTCNLKGDVSKISADAGWNLFVKK